MTNKNYPVYKKYWCVEPRDTALFRDARPFGAGEAASSLPFPWPSTIAGFTRSRLGMSADHKFEWTPAQARAVAVAGPWLVELEASEEIVKDHLFPAPRDAVFFRVEGNEGQLIRRRLAPRAQREDEWSDLPEGKQLVGFARDPGETPGKPARGPAMWNADTLQTWLNEPDAHDEEQVMRDGVGMDALPRERRTHVKIDYKTQTAETGALFQTEQLRFERYDAKQGVVRRFALGVATQADNVDDERMSTSTSATGSLGGERRMASVYRIQDALPLTCPELGDDEEIIRVVLLTPAIFEAGYCPSAKGLGDDVKVIAAATDRFQAVSGWCFEKRGPKPTRYMAPAGSVYWLRIPGGAAAWATDRHLTCISDDPQDRLDGFGLIAIGRA